MSRLPADHWYAMVSRNVQRRFDDVRVRDVDEDDHADLQECIEAEVDRAMARYLARRVPPAPRPRTSTGMQQLIEDIFRAPKKETN